MMAKQTIANQVLAELKKGIGTSVGIAKATGLTTKQVSGAFPGLERRGVVERVGKRIEPGCTVPATIYKLIDEAQRKKKETPDSIALAELEKRNHTAYTLCNKIGKSADRTSSILRRLYRGGQIKVMRATCGKPIVYGALNSTLTNLVDDDIDKELSKKFRVFQPKKQGIACGVWM